MEHRRWVWVETSQGWIAGEIVEDKDAVIVVSIRFTAPIANYPFVKETFDHPGISGTKGPQ